MSAAAVWALVGVILGFVSAFCSLVPTPPRMARIGAACLGAAVACVAAALVIVF